MARTIAQGDIYVAKTFCTRANQLGINVRHWYVPGISGLSVTETAAADEMSTALGPLYKAYLNAADRYEGLTLQRIWPVPVLERVVSLDEAGVGDSSGEYLPNQCSGIVTLTTGIAGRRYRGRLYLPFWSEGDNTTGGIPGAGALALMNALGAYFTNIVTFGAGGDEAQFEPIVYHGDGDFTPVTGAFARSYWGTQRRRGLATQQNDILILA